MPSVAFTTKTTTSTTTMPAPATGRAEYFDASLPSFGLRVTANGHRSFFVLYRHQGRQQRFTIGTHQPGPGAAIRIALGDARDQAKGILQRAANGENPQAKKMEGRTAATVKDLAERYITEWAKPRKRTWKKDENILAKDLIPSLGSKKPGEVTREDVRRIIAAVNSRGSPVQANRTLEIIRKFFNWLADEEVIERSPCERVRKLNDERAFQRSRILSPDEMQAVWRALPEIDPAIASAYRLLFWSGTRKSEVLNMQRAEIAGEWWTFGGERSKNRKPHRVYLIEAARAELATLCKTTRDDDRVFPSRGKTGLTFAIYAEHESLSELSGVQGWRPHDIWRTVASGIASLGFSRFVVELILNHADNSTAGRHYDLYGYDRERQQALTAWGARLADIIAGKPPAASNVVSMPFQAQAV